MYAGLEIGGIASPNANHYWGNCKSFWQIDSPNFFGTANHFWPIGNHYSKEFAKRPFFSKFPFIKPILCIGCKNANKL